MDARGRFFLTLTLAFLSLSNSLYYAPLGYVINPGFKSPLVQAQFEESMKPLNLNPLFATDGGRLFTYKSLLSSFSLLVTHTHTRFVKGERILQQFSTKQLNLTVVGPCHVRLLYNIKVKGPNNQLKT